MDYKLFIFLICTKCVVSWDSEQMEVFDVVEEVKQNFYEMLNVTQVKQKKILIKEKLSF